MSKCIYIPSTTPGMTWSLFDTKHRGIVGAAAWEGRYTQDDMECFEFVPFQDRAMQYTGTDKRATDKSKAAAIAALTVKLREQGWIA